MNKIKKIGLNRIVLLLIFNAIVVPILGHAEGRMSVGGQLNALIGTGYDLNQKKFKGECIEGDIAFEGHQIGGIAGIVGVSQDQLSQHLGLEVGGRARMGVIEASAAANFLNQSKSDKFSISFLYVGDYTFKDRILTHVRLNQLGENLFRNTTFWNESCGDEFIQRLEIGGKIFISIRIDFSSIEDKNYFKSNFSVAGPLLSAHRELETMKESLSKDTRITVNAFQIGGAVQKISNIFHDINAVDGEVGAQGPMDFVECSLGAFDKCAKVLQRALDYATNNTNGFPSQVDPTNHAMGSPEGPAVLAVHTQKYVTAGIRAGSTPELEQAAKIAREKISKLFEKNYACYLQANHLARRPVIRLSPRQSEIIATTELLALENLRKISAASIECFDNPASCPDHLKVLLHPGDAELKGATHLIEIDEAVFDIQPETIAQYCDLGYSARTSPGLSETMKRLVQVARLISPDSFFNAGGKIDECLITQNVLAGLKELDLSLSAHKATHTDDFKVRDLRPVVLLSGLEELDLSNLALVDISQLKELKSLVKLNLSSNRILDIRPLSELDRLVELNLSNNRLVSVEPLAALNYMRVLDLRNNHKDIVCPYQDLSRCLIEDYKSGYSFVRIQEPRVLNPARGHSAEYLRDGSIFIQGSCSSDCGIDRFGANLLLSYAQLCSSDFSSVKDIQCVRRLNTGPFSSVYTASSPLESGNLLITGGLTQVHNNLLSNHYIDSGFAWIYDIKTETLTQKIVPDEIEKSLLRYHHSSTPVGNGDILIAGGLHSVCQSALNTALIYSHLTGLFEKIASLTIPRSGHAAIALRENRVLILGGSAEDRLLDSGEILVKMGDKYSFKPMRAHMIYKRSGHTLTEMNDGKILIVGGGSETAEIFDPFNESFSEIAWSVIESRSDHSALKLEDGRILISGGRVVNLTSGVDSISQTAEIFDPVFQRFTLIGESMNVARSGHKMFLLPFSRVLIVGGAEKSGSPVEIFSYTSR